MNNYTKIKHICFDLDGTLVNSSKTIYLATIEALEKLSLSSNLAEEKFSGMIGKHFVDIFNELNIYLPDFKDFISIYKSVYFNFIDKSILYNHVEETLDYFNDNEVKVSLLTTKAQDQADKIINHFNLNDKMNYIMGRRDGIAHKPSPEPLLKICGELKIDTAETLMVGDTDLDIQCGKNAKAKTCGVLYGYRTKEQIEKEKPDFIISNLGELLSLDIK
ncbi:MAG: HAD family hydrolase [Ignavibacteria bacterium]|nr:HAD family hydrolase [Ignavibacteria bacterium]